MKVGKDFIGVGVGVMIFNTKNQILLGLRNKDPEKADSELHGEGTWTMPGGKIELQEGLIQSAVREVKEETNLDASALKLISVATDAVFDAHFITIGFLCREFSGILKVMEPEEITEWKWFDMDNLPKNLFFPSEKIIKNFNNNQIYSDE